CVSSVCEIPCVSSLCEISCVSSLCEIPCVSSLCEIPCVSSLYTLCELHCVSSLCEIPCVSSLCEIPCVSSLCEIPCVSSLCELPSQLLIPAPACQCWCSPRCIKSSWCCFQFGKGHFKTMLPEDLPGPFTWFCFTQGAPNGDGSPPFHMHSEFIFHTIVTLSCKEHKLKKLTLVKCPADEEREHVEVCPGGGVLVQRLTNQISDDGGAALIMDYGHAADKTDTFRDFHGHKLHDVLMAIDMMMNPEKMGERFKFFALVPQSRIAQPPGKKAEQKGAAAPTACVRFE
ncbi:NDUF7 methyltransferase, partial [Polyodon spathula]|nr:NDUF7 methyltransferase [Polyodon spathula]